MLFYEKNYLDRHYLFDAKKEAERIGNALLRKRSIACYDCVPRSASGYFWQPKAGTIEKIKGVIVFLTTLPTFVPAVYRSVKKLHSDKVPFLATAKLNTVPSDSYHWLPGELQFYKNAKARSSSPRPRKNASPRHRLTWNTDYRDGWEIRVRCALQCIRRMLCLHTEHRWQHRPSGCPMLHLPPW